MSDMTRSHAIFVLSTAGVLFAGYMSGVKFFTTSCAFNEGCPYFLGYPACYFGFAMFVTLFISSAHLVIGRLDRNRLFKVLIGVSALGMIFSGYFTSLELPKLFSEGLSAYILVLPTCAWGLLVYVAIFAMSLIARGERQA